MSALGHPLKNRDPLNHSMDGGALALMFAERVTYLYDAQPLSLCAVLINGALLSIVQWPVVGQGKTACWAGLVLTVTILRFGLYHAFRSKAPEPEHSARWFSLFLAGALCSGATWGSTAYFLFPVNAPAHLVFVLFVVGGMAVGSVTSLSASFRANMCFLVAALTPLIIRLFLLESYLCVAMGLMTSLFFVMTVVAAWRSNRQIKNAIKRQYRCLRAEATIEFQAFHDSLTQLGNRRFLIDRLDQEISRCERHKFMAAVLFIDIDRFKAINDSLGHAVGDALLCEFARRIKSNVRREDTTARLGGDEFVVILSELDMDETTAARRAQRHAEKIRSILSEPYVVEKRVLHTTPSIGIAMFPFESADANEVLKQSDIAMYRAKQLGRNTTQFYMPEMQLAAKKRLLIENDLREALRREEMELYYQPQFDAAGGIVGAEALLRWNHNERGMILPADFVAIAEETGIILSLGEWVIYTACNQLKGWLCKTEKEQLTRLPSISVNVSPRQFRQQDFFRRVEHIIEQTGVNPRCLELELTESMLIENVEETASKMEQLSGLGVRLAIDDFGTGYSSLFYLTHLPLHRIKIDQSLVRNVDKIRSSTTVVQTIITMAYNLGLDVIAEGVETEAEFQFLRNKGCHTYQGYHFCKPLPMDVFSNYLLEKGKTEQGGIVQSF